MSYPFSSSEEKTLSRHPPCVENRSLPPTVEDNLLSSISGQPTIVQESMLPTFDEGNLSSTRRQPLNTDEGLSSLQPTPLADMFMSVFSSHDWQLQSVFSRPSSTEDVSLTPLFENLLCVNLNPENPMLDRPASAEDESLKPMFKKPFYVNLNPKTPELHQPTPVEDGSLNPKFCLPHSDEWSSLSSSSEQQSSAEVSLLPNVSTQLPSALQQVRNLQRCDNITGLTLVALLTTNK